MKFEEKLKARELRLQGQSIKQIAIELGVAKSSVSVWVRDIKLSDEQLNIMIKEKRWTIGQIKASEVQKSMAIERRQLYLEKGYERAKCDENFRLICAIYWGEGSKGKNAVQVSNCDPIMIALFAKWFTNNGYDYSFRVQYYGENGLTEKEIVNWWKNEAQLKENCFRKFTICKINRASQKKKIGKLPYGTGYIYVGRTELLYNIFGGINYLKEKLNKYSDDRLAYVRGNRA